MYKDSHLRSCIKAFSWRLTATLTTAALVFLFTGEMKLAFAIGSVDFFVKIAIYFAHEKIWDTFHFGKKSSESFVVWFTGLSGSGKTTLSKKILEHLESKRLKTDYLDGDKIRSILPAMGFSREARDQHIQKVGFLASMLEKNGVIAVCSFVSPYEEARQFVRGLCNNFVEVHVSTPLEVCEKRDIKGLYAKARRGEIKNFTGIDDPYEMPSNPELTIDTSNMELDTAAQLVIDYLEKRFK